MPVVCPIDFSEASLRASEVALGIAAKLGTKLQLVYLLVDSPQDPSPGEQLDLAAARSALTAQAAALSGRGAIVEVRVELAGAEEAVLKSTNGAQPSLLVIAATGTEKTPLSRLGSTADRLAQTAHCPVLVLRDCDPFHRWLRGESSLQIIVGLDFNLVSDAAWRWALGLRRLGDVEVVGVHVYSRSSEQLRLGLEARGSPLESARAVEAVLSRDLEKHFPSSSSIHAIHRLHPGVGATAAELVAIAREARAAVVVVGSHDRALSSSTRTRARSWSKPETSAPPSLRLRSASAPISSAWGGAKVRCLANRSRPVRSSAAC